jgi:uncharacterized membrane protein
VQHEHSRQLIDRYLQRVSDELRDIPTADRLEILEDIRAHVHESLGDVESATEVDVRNTLERLGDPELVAREARDRAPSAASVAPTPPSHDHSRTPGALEVAAIVLTVLFWPIGVLLAWISERWKTRDKVIATAIPFVSTMMFALIVVVGALLVWDTSGSVVTSTMDQVQPAQPAPPPGIEGGSVPPPEPRSPQEISEATSDGAVVSRFVVVIGFLGGIVAGPFVSAIYLAIRLQPQRRNSHEHRYQQSNGIPAGGRA